MAKNSNTIKSISELTPEQINSGNWIHVTRTSKGGVIPLSFKKKSKSELKREAYFNEVARKKAEKNGNS